jgi:hypothetical protein
MTRALAKRPPARAKRRYPDPDEAKEVVLVGANLIAGVLDVLGEVQRGTSAPRAAKKAIRRVKARDKAIREAEKALREGGEDDI